MRVIVWRLFMADKKFLRTKDMKSWVSSAYRRCEIEEALMRELRGVVWRLKRNESRTEPCGTPQVTGDEGELCGGIPTVDVRDERYEVNHCSEREEMPHGIHVAWVGQRQKPRYVGTKCGKFLANASTSHMKFRLILLLLLCWSV